MAALRPRALHGGGGAAERGSRRSTATVIAVQLASFRTHVAVIFVVMRLALLKIAGNASGSRTIGAGIASVGKSGSVSATLFLARKLKIKKT